MYLISNISNRFLEHKHDTNCISISREMKYDLFGQYRWRNNIASDNEHVFNQLFTKKIFGNSYQNVTDGYEPTPLLINSYYKWLSHNPSFELIDVNDIKVTAKGIKMDDDSESRGDFFEEIDINIEHIVNKLIEYWEPVQNFIDNMSVTVDEELRKFVKYQVEPLRRMYDYIIRNNNRLRIYYKQSESGRYYSIGQNSIHALKKEVRNIILSDYHEYDIAVSAPLILSQIYKQISGDEKVFETISFFVKNKKRIREIFAEKYNIPLDKSKTFFTSLFFGSRLQLNDFYYHSAVTQTLDKDIVNSILSDKTSYDYLLYADVKKIFHVIGNHYKRINTKKVIGYNGHTLKLDKWKNESVVAHIYQSAESMILESMVKFYTSKTNDYNYVRLHDCIYTKQVINESELYRFIKRETNFDTLFVEPISKQASDEIIYQKMNM